MRHTDLVRRQRGGQQKSTAERISHNQPTANCIILQHLIWLDLTMSFFLSSPINAFEGPTVAFLL